MHIVCSSCGRENLAQARFCDACGDPLAATVPMQDGIRSWIIGSAPDCDVVVAQPTVSGRHCRLVQTASGFMLEDLGSTNGTYVNGCRISQSVRVTRGDAVTLGKNIVLPWPAAGPCAGVVKEIRIGRDADNDVVLDYPMISGHHARVLISDGVMTIEDLGSTNGTAIGSPERKITRSRLAVDDTVYFGSFHIPAARLLSGDLRLGRKPHTSVTFVGQAMVLGRAPDCDKVLDHPMVSWHHARILRAGDAFTVEDLGSTNGTFVNGQRISGPVRIKVGDQIGLGSFTLEFKGAGAFEQRDYRGNVTIEARGVTVDVPRRRLLEDVSLTIYPSEIVALMGPAGAGKTTLMNALNGYTPATRGAVLINGQDLYANYDQFRGHIGYVPQDDIMHRELTVGQALYYTARLRLPSDYRRADIKKRIQNVLGLLGMEGTEDVIIGSPEKKGISGGQRKRVNLAMELLSDPSILFLDEPTSGLSSEDALMVMKALRDLADAGKTILITIHQPGLEVFRMMDSLAVVSRDRGATGPARLVYFGPAYPDAVEFFNPDGVPNARPGVDPSPDEILRGLAKGKTDEWAARYAASRYKRQYVDERAGRRPAQSAVPVVPKMSRAPGLAQWWTLVKRCLAVKVKDRWGTLIQLALAPIIGLIIVLALGEARDETALNSNFSKTIYTLFLLVISAVFMGCWGSVREIISEWAIYRRERMVNLKIPSYVASKFTVLGGLLCLVQCPALLAIVYYGCGLKGDWLPMLGVLSLTGLAALGHGLMISAIMRTSEAAINVAVIVMVLMLLLGGAFSQVHHRGRASRPFTHLIASRWAFEGLLLLESEARGTFAVQEPAAAPAQSQTRAPGFVSPQPAVDLAERLSHFPKDQRFGVAWCVAILGAMLVALFTGVIIALKLRDIH